eukprot:214310_1
MPKYTHVASSQNIGVDLNTNECTKTRSSKRIYNNNQKKNILIKKISLISCMVISVVIAISTTYFAYKTILRGHHYNKIGNSYNIEVLCECTNVRVETETECTTSSGGGHPDSRSDSTTTRCNTEYTTHYIVSLIDYYDHTACSEYLSENIDISFSETSSSSELFCSEGEQIKCFTNNECDELFVDDENSFHDKAIDMYVAAGSLCVVGCCCISCCMMCFNVLMKWKFFF